MVNVKVEYKLQRSSGASAWIYPKIPESKNYHTQVTSENWYPNIPWFGSGTWGSWVTVYNASPSFKTGDTFAIGFEPQSNVITQAECKVTINGVLRKYINFDNLNNDLSYFQFSGNMEAPAPTYLETLDKLDQWSSAQYIPNSRNELNL